MDTCYGKIETLYTRDENTHRLIQPLVLKNRIYGLLKTWRFTEKIDGTNIRVIWYPFVALCGHVLKGWSDNFCSACGTEVKGFGPGQLSFGGKTDNAQIHADLVKHLYGMVTAEQMKAVFPDTPAVLYGEGYGAGIQKGGGDYSPTKKFILFDVLVDGTWWLSYENICDVAAKLSFDVVPDFGEMTLEDATELVRVGFQSKLNGGKAKSEGLVGRPLEALFDKKGARLIVKLKTKDF